MTLYEIGRLAVVTERACVTLRNRVRNARAADSPVMMLSLDEATALADDLLLASQVAGKLHDIENDALREAKTGNE